MNAHTHAHAYDSENAAIEAPTEEIDSAKPTKKSGKSKRSKAEIGASLTLDELAERYLKHLEEAGKSHGTCFSYAIELRTACKALGVETLVGSLTANDVQLYFESDAVMKLKNGKPKAQPSYLKTRRVLRLALCWAVEKGWLESAPIPEQTGAGDGESK